MKLEEKRNKRTKQIWIKKAQARGLSLDGLVCSGLENPGV
jgi:hypothetical protein